ncbi:MULTISPECIES: succinylglutamate desuccinylase/aspartoacylase family protein [unclassified Pseudomonas]|uniref:succinylglutamate desuccinylase/aspartoacylase family protein n=1 Tax=unclassified Pseudomonas TaxID=196821 RepID=UPI0015A03BED|nr:MULTISPECIES: succinylglutamate desuccinylase/aspartoacylase family protein [unclassified Pseudomonas]NVZ12361.1 succinylglutamate desuccinylase/aspartoacylase family protein [Pseudomonas sp. IPO3775]NWA75241.1 succinylglutamate desuccinylase/aspartoacylase family protein [Pseudomonas sp. C8002]
MKLKSHPLLQATPGTHRHVDSEHYGAMGASRKIYIQAALHADETPALLVAAHLRRQLAELENANRLNAQIVLVAVANPTGLSQYIMGAPSGRFELGSGRNYNRGFPVPYQAIADRIEHLLGQDIDANRQLIRQAWGECLLDAAPLDEFQSLQRTLMLLAHDADIVLDLHCSREAAMHVYTGEAVWATVEPLARYIGSEASLLATDSQANSFDEALYLLWVNLRERFGDRFPIPDSSVAVTVEHRGQRDVSYELAEHDATAIIDYLTHLGAVEGAPRPLPALRNPATPLAGSEQFYAPCAGVLVHRAAVGSRIEAGQALFDIVDPHSGQATTVCSHNTGVLYMRRDVRFVKPGDPLGRVSGATPIRSGKLLSA